MELNREMMEELKQLSTLSAQLKDAENLWGEQCTARWTAVERGAGQDVVQKHSEQIINTVNRIAYIKNMIVEHVHLLAAQYNAIPSTESQEVQP